MWCVVDAQGEGVEWVEVLGGKLLLLFPLGILFPRISLDWLFAIIQESAWRSPSQRGAPNRLNWVITLPSYNFVLTFNTIIPRYLLCLHLSSPLKYTFFKNWCLTLALRTLSYLPVSSLVSGRMPSMYLVITNIFLKEWREEWRVECLKTDE